jgi:hypothetical protein
MKLKRKWKWRLTLIIACCDVRHSDPNRSRDFIFKWSVSLAVLLSSSRWMSRQYLEEVTIAFFSPFRLFTVTYDHALVSFNVIPIIRDHGQTNSGLKPLHPGLSRSSNISRIPRRWVTLPLIQHHWIIYKPLSLNIKLKKKNISFRQSAINTWP